MENHLTMCITFDITWFNLLNKRDWKADSDGFTAYTISNNIHTVVQSTTNTKQAAFVSRILLLIAWMELYQGIWNKNRFYWINTLKLERDPIDRSLDRYSIVLNFYHPSQNIKNIRIIRIHCIFNLKMEKLKNIVCANCVREIQNHL